MKTRFNIPHWLQGEDIPGPEQLSHISNASLHREYENEGDEFVYDAIRIVDQDFGQIDGSLEAWKMRSARGLNK